MENLQQDRQPISIWRMTLRALTVVFAIVPIPGSGGPGGTDKPVYCLMTESFIEYFKAPPAKLDADGFPILPQRAK